MQGIRTHMYLYPTARSAFVILANGEGDYARVTAAVREQLPA